MSWGTREPMESRYSLAKNLFLDRVDEAYWIEHDVFVGAYHRLQANIEKPIKMIMVFGRPGTGKSMLLNHLYSKQRDKREIHYFETPAGSEQEFGEKIFSVLAGKPLPAHNRVNFARLLEYCKGFRGKREIILLLDEAQLYPQSVMEQIRLLSDTQVMKFVVSLHRIENEDLLAQPHFRSRIWDHIELRNGTPDEVQDYLREKLLKGNLYALAGTIRKRDSRLIHALTRGNYREINKLLFAVFEIYEHYDRYDSGKIEYDTFSRKIIEMAGIKLGLIHA